MLLDKGPMGTETQYGVPAAMVEVAKYELTQLGGAVGGKMVEAGGAMGRLAAGVAVDAGAVAIVAAFGVIGTAHELADKAVRLLKGYDD